MVRADVVKSLRSLWLSAVLGALVPVAVGCGAPAPAKGPRDVLTQYAVALDEGRVQDAYALLSDEAKKTLPFDAFQRMVKENPDEVKQVSRSLLRPSGPPRVTATVSSPSGESLLLVYEEGEWRVDGSAIDLYSQASPKAALMAFVRAFENKRWDILMRFVPESESEGLSAKKLETYWTGEQKEELESLTRAIKAALPTAKLEVIGDHATMPYGGSGTVELLLEGGRWKIQEFK